MTIQLKYQGSPFSHRGFSADGLQLPGLPVAAASFWAWRQLSAAERLLENLRAYRVYSALLPLVAEEQTALNPTALDLLKLLRETHSQIRQLVCNLTGVMRDLGLRVPGAAGQPLPSPEVRTPAWERKVRGYLVCVGLTAWLERTVRDLTFLKKKHRQ
ncbi:cardiotrophin-2-like [Polyodon spathula]|uniref:cardiotrophin-2-like n=1 Tax=Polyodon spathula TaxID=7913 RepID=UPI001B7E5D68|nr:cardiotrophin-2-like [Polyodon spathula]